MKKIATYTTAGILSLLGQGCAPKADTEIDIATINLEESISMKATDSITNRFNVERLIKLEETDKSLIANVTLVDQTDDSTMMVHDIDRIYFFNKNSGKYIGNISHRGNGPGEYTNLISAKIEQDGNIGILDNIKGHYITYAPNGTLINDYSVAGIDDLHPTTNGYIGLSSIATGKGLDIVYFDKNLSETDRVPTGFKGGDSRGLIRQISFDNGSTLSVTFNDTVWSISPDAEIAPHIALIRGKYHPKEAEYDMTQDKSGFITGISHLQHNDLIFLKYYFDKSIYFDIWSVSNGTLLYRNIANSPDDIFGMSLNVEGHPIELWPYTAIDGKLYCTIIPDKMADFLNCDEANPGIAVLTID